MGLTKEEIKTLLNKLQNDPNNRFDLDYFNKKNPNPYEWKTVLEGTKGSIYENGYYMLKITFPQNYPDSCPSVTFLNKIFHPHVSDSGSACIHPVSNDIIDVLNCVENMFIDYDADIDHAYRHIPTQTYKKDVNEFIQTAQKWVRDYAKIEDLDKFYD